MSQYFSELNGKDVTFYFLVTFLNLTGIPYKIPKVLCFIWYTLYLTYMIIALITSAIALFGLQGAVNIIYSLIHALHGAFLNFSTVLIRVNARPIVELVRIKESHLDKCEWGGIIEKHFAKSNEKFEKFLVRRGLFLILLMFLGTLVAPLLSAFVTDNKLGSSPTMIANFWFPWTIDSLSTYLASYGIQCLLIATCLIPVAANMVFLMYVVMEIEVQSGVLLAAVKDIPTYSKRITEELVDNGDIPKADFDKTYSKLMQQHLKEFIRYHHIVTLFINNFKLGYKWMYIGTIMHTTILSALLSYTMVLILNKRDTAEIIQPATEIGGMLTYCWLYCHIGELLNNFNKAVTDALYDIKWYEQPVELQRVVLQFLRVSQQPLSLKAGFTYIASFNLLTSVMKLSYSYFSVLYNLFKV